MFFILSKTLNYLTMPVVIICICFFVFIILKKQPWKKYFFWMGFAALLLFSNDFIANELMLAWEIKPVAFATLKKHYEYGIVLTGVTLGKRNPDDRVYFNKGADRIVHTVQLYKLGYIKKLIISGGNGSLIDVEEREADELKRAALLMGVPAADIILENKSRNTHESAEELKKMFADKITPDDCILITSAFHMRRSLACFKKAGLSMDTFSTDLYTHKRDFTPDVLFIPNAGAVIIWTKLIKEWTGFLAYKMAGYI
jgi:uncharacterized SAM-binding protein YcdF (DUF218 family)